MKSIAIFILIITFSVPCLSQLYLQQTVKRDNFIPSSHIKPGLIFEDDKQSNKKNIGLAALYSLLLPGMGELYVGEYNVGKYFTITEGGLWITWAAFQLLGNWVRSDARAYAIQYAGISAEGKSDQFYVDIGNFRSMHQYNEQVLRSRDPYKIYDSNLGYFWNWDTPERQEQYRQLRVSSDRILNNSQFVAAAIVVNHLVSAINAGRMALSHNKRQQEQVNIRARIFGDLQTNCGFMITLTKHF